MDGRLPNVFICDECGALPNSYPIQAMRSGQLNILNKLGCIISTKYNTIQNPFEDEISYSKKVLDGFIAATGQAELSIWETDTMTGINWAEVPSTILEMGYMSNPEEDKRMAEDAFQQAAAQGVADGLDAFFAQ